MYMATSNYLIAMLSTLMNAVAAKQIVILFYGLSKLFLNLYLYTNTCYKGIVVTSISQHTKAFLPLVITLAFITFISTNWLSIGLRCISAP